MFSAPGFTSDASQNSNQKSIKTKKMDEYKKVKGKASKVRRKKGTPARKGTPINIRVVIPYRAYQKPKSSNSLKSCKINNSNKSFMNFNNGRKLINNYQIILNIQINQINGVNTSKQKFNQIYNDNSKNQKISQEIQIRNQQTFKKFNPIGKNSTQEDKTQIKINLLKEYLVKIN
ncbi:hypothetical protein ABPG72_018586 [Tetrahymena utriculariae]